MNTSLRAYLLPCLCSPLAFNSLKLRKLEFTPTQSCDVMEASPPTHPPKKPIYFNPFLSW